LIVLRKQDREIILFCSITELCSVHFNGAQFRDTTDSKIFYILIYCYGRANDTSNDRLSL